MKSSSALPDSRVAIAVLAAGLSTRFGRRKLQADLGGAPLWQWAVAAAEEAGFARRILVISADDPPVMPPGWQIVINDEAGEGIAASIRLAVGAAIDCSRIVLALADMPFVSSAHLRRIADGTRPVFTAYPKGKIGIPAAFPKVAFDRLLTLRGRAGASSLEWPDADPCIPPDQGHMLMDVDTPADLADAAKLAQAAGFRKNGLIT